MDDEQYLYLFKNNHKIKLNDIFHIIDIKIHEKEQNWEGRPFYLKYNNDKEVFLIINISKKVEVSIKVTLNNEYYKIKRNCLNAVSEIINFCYSRYLYWNMEDKKLFDKLIKRINKKFSLEKSNFIDCEFWFYRNSHQRCIIV